MRERILETSAEWFFSKSYKEVKLGEIARYLGISKKTIYNHFPGKRFLFLECIDFFSSRQLDQVATIVDAESDYVLKLRGAIQFARQSTELNASDKGLWNDIPQADLAMIRKKIGERIFDFTYGLVLEGIEKGIFRHDLPAKACVLMVVALIRTQFEHEYRFFGTEVPEDFAGFVEKVLFEGMMTDEGIKQYREK